MAIPQREDPNLPRRDVVIDGTARPARRGGAVGWWWAWIIIAGLVIWWAGWGWGGSGGYWWGRQGGYGVAANGTAATGRNGMTNTGNTYAGYGNGANANNAQATGAGVQVLDSSNKKEFIGQHFAANNLPVQQKVNDHAMWLATTNNGQPMLAVVQQSNNALSDVSQGSRVDASGTVEKAPPINEAKSEFHLNDQQAQRLEQEGAYIQVSQLTSPQNMAQR